MKRKFAHKKDRKMALKHKKRCSTLMIKRNENQNYITIPFFIYHTGKYLNMPTYSIDEAVGKQDSYILLTVLFIYFMTERDRETQAAFSLSAQSPTHGLNP